LNVLKNAQANVKGEAAMVPHNVIVTIEMNAERAATIAVVNHVSSVLLHVKGKLYLKGSQQA
jgi:hypothetical protein